MRHVAFVLAIVVVCLCGCTDDSRPTRSEYLVQANAVFCDDLLSARQVVIDLVNGQAGVTPEQVVDDHDVAAIIEEAESVVDRLGRVARDPVLAATATGDLTRPATSATLTALLSDYGLRPC